jgi:glutaredoxin
MAHPPVKMYTLSTCRHCKAAKQLLRDCGVAFEYTDVDLLDGAEREAALAEVRRHNPECSFPTILIGDEVIVGNDEAAIRRALRLP